jgi:hypothetical protein
MATPVTPTADDTSTAEGQDTAEKLDRTLDRWRARIDELTVQMDLATLDVREDVSKRLEVTENIYLAIRSRLSDARHDAGQNVATMRQSVAELLTDLRRAYDDAEAVVKRSHES